MKRHLAIVWAIAVGLSLSVSLFAHHGSAAFDTGKRVMLKGTVKEWVYSNPHVLLRLEVIGDDNKPVQWIAEGQAPNVIFPIGYRKDSFKAGDEVTVVANPVKNGLPIGRIVSVVTASGWTLGGINDTAIPPKGK